MAKVPLLRLKIVKRSDSTKGFVVLPRRWVVERTFSWFGCNRRLGKDFENLADTLATFVTVASIQLALRRLARTQVSSVDPVASGERRLWVRRKDLRQEPREWERRADSRPLTPRGCSDAQLGYACYRKVTEHGARGDGGRGRGALQGAGRCGAGTAHAAARRRAAGRLVRRPTARPSADDRRSAPSLDPNLAAIAEYVEPNDLIVDAGGGAGRISLPLALRCRGVINVEPSVAMAAGFRANAARAGIDNTSVIESDWLAAEPGQGTLALANHVAYHTRDIVPFIEKLEHAGRRRVVITVNDPVPPSWHSRLFELVHGEAEEAEPGHVELANVLWEMGILPDIRVLPTHAAQPIRQILAPTREAAISRTLTAYAPQ